MISMKVEGMEGILYPIMKIIMIIIYIMV